MDESRQAQQGALLRELRVAWRARIDGGADPGEVTADLERRLQRLAEHTALPEPTY